MKNWIIGAITVLSMNANSTDLESRTQVMGTKVANPTPSTAEWSLETGTLLVYGEAAQDLYLSLIAEEALDPHQTNDKTIENRIKSNAFATCRGQWTPAAEGSTTTEWTLDSAWCQLFAPEGTTEKTTPGD